jgi:Ca2+-binding EF-hand superfamily protein
MAVRPLLNGHNNNRHLTPEELENNIGGLAVTDAKLREIFDSYDVNRNGVLDFDEVKKYYLNQEHYGHVPTDSDVERFIRKYSNNPNGKVSFDEFAAMWLSFAQK